jgi:hypothetical protein
VDFPATSNHAYWQSAFTAVEPRGVDELSLRRAGGNPQGELTVELTLPRAGFASIELFDAAGRRLARRGLPNLGLGTHRVTVAKTGELEPGLYFVRLSHNGESRQIKASVVD